MNYVIVLNWNSHLETINCLNSLLLLNTEIKVIICDNYSEIDSYKYILNYLKNLSNVMFVNLNENEIDSYVINKEKIILIRNNKNYGYAGGNNRGLTLAKNQLDMEYVWILNNDTVLDSESLNEMIKKFKNDNLIGICGSKLIDYYDKKTVQSIGGKINTWTCTTRSLGRNLVKSDHINELEIENKIDFVVGASILINKECLVKVGLLCEEYFLYYEEIDICNRAKAAGFKIGVASKSYVYHMEGGSTTKEISDLTDYLMVRNRVIISKKFYKDKVFFVKLSLLFVILNRFRRGYFKRAIKYFSFIRI